MRRTLPLHFDAENIAAEAERQRLRRKLNAFSLSLRGFKSQHKTLRTRQNDIEFHLVQQKFYGKLILIQLNAFFATIIIGTILR